MKHDFGYPFGFVECDTPDNVQVVTASCGCAGGEDSLGHSQCAPNWEENVKRDGAVVRDGPILDSYSGWIALVEYPNA